MSRTRSAPGGGTVVEVSADRLPGWVNRFAGRNGGVANITAKEHLVLLTASDGTTAEIAVPFPPMRLADREGVEALLDHLAGLGGVGIIAVRAGAHSIGVAKAGVVVSSKTDRAYLQGRTAAGGWSQQRFARRRGNQLTTSLADAARDAAKVLIPVVAQLDALVVAGDAKALSVVLADTRLQPLLALPRRVFGDIPEPRRTVIDDLAERIFDVEITIRNP
ncbi:hypothetical protein EH165_07770 [Nakamurella antarctica]|uniref:Actinobacteria/chloroflexi VLRF1 release factor domain-containing protein n=1 Tax=Nakamurella antarctica TaxID=1902245 RepID=A0A3G8ZMN9_9ACTN|nr:acVLRF1 family peptidyl-tRNA hydrolase [Nakamurella antarctica]AZI58055.1 hypothetical protein EH165_07770 [Nakamurella antarctica]